MAIQLCVAVVIENGNKILLLQEEKDKVYEKSKGLWTLPVGKVNKNESLVNAALRETKEETGHDIKLSGVIGIYQLFTAEKKDQVFGVAFKGKLTKRQKSKSPEFKKLIWINAKKILRRKMKLRKGVKEIIKDYQKDKILPISQIKFIDL